MAGITREDVIQIAEEEGLPPEFALNIWEQESGSGSNDNTSVDGARGGFQVMPATFKTVLPDGSIDDPWDNARAGIRVLKRAFDKNNGDPTSIFQTYHSGSIGYYTRRGNLKQDGTGKTTLSYVQDALGRQNKMVKSLSNRKKRRSGVDVRRSYERRSPELPSAAPLAAKGAEKFLPYDTTPFPTDEEQAQAAENSPYGDSFLDDLDKQLLKLIDEV